MAGPGRYSVPATKKRRKSGKYNEYDAAVGAVPGVAPHPGSGLPGAAPSVAAWNAQVAGAAVAPSAPSAPTKTRTQALRDYREQRKQGRSEDGSSDKKGGKAPKKGVGETSTARSIAKAGNLDFKAIPKKGGLDAKRQNKDARERRKRGANRIGQVVGEALTAAIQREHQVATSKDAGGGPLTEKGRRDKVAEAERSIEAFRAIRNDPKQGKTRKDIAADISEQDWKVAKEEGLEAVEGKDNPWDKVKTPRGRRRLAQAMAEGRGIMLPSEKQAELDAKRAADPMAPLKDLLGADAYKRVWEDVKTQAGMIAKGDVVGAQNMSTLNLGESSLADKAEVAASVFAGAKAGGMAVKGFSRAMSGADEALRAGKGTAAMAASAARATESAKKFRKYKRAMEKPVRPGGKITRRQVLKGAHRGAWLATPVAAVGTGAAQRTAEGVAQANVMDSLHASGRTLIGMFTFPLTAGANVGISGKRLARLGLGDDTFTAGEAVGPAREMSKAFYDEAKHMFSTYWTGSPEDIKKMTETEYGYLGPLNAAVMTGAGLKGAGLPIFNAAASRIPAGRGEKGWSDGPTVRDQVDNFNERMKGAVVNVRNLGMKMNTVTKITGRFTKSRQRLNGPRYKYAQEGLDAYNAAGRNDPESGGRWVDVDFGTVAVAPIILGYGRKMSKEQREKELASDLDGTGFHSRVMEAMGVVPDDAWNPKTRLGKLVKKMQIAFEEDIQPYLQREGKMDLENKDALIMETLATMERITRGEVNLGLRDEPVVAPEAPRATADKRFDALVEENNLKIRQHEDPKGKAVRMVEKAKRAAFNAESSYTAMSTAADRITRANAEIAEIFQGRQRGKQLTKKQAGRVRQLREDIAVAEVNRAKWTKMSEAKRERLAATVVEKKEAAARADQEWKDQRQKYRDEASRLEGRLSDEEDAVLKKEAEVEAERIANPEDHIDAVRAENEALAKELEWNDPDMLRHTKLKEDMEALIEQRKGEKSGATPEEVTEAEGARLILEHAGIDVTPDAKIDYPMAVSAAEARGIPLDMPDGQRVRNIPELALEIARHEAEARSAGRNSNDPSTRYNAEHPDQARANARMIELQKERLHNEDRLKNGTARERRAAKQRLREINSESAAVRNAADQRSRDTIADATTALYKAKVAKASEAKVAAIKKELEVIAREDLNLRFREAQDEYGLIMGSYITSRGVPEPLPREKKTTGQSQVMIPEISRRDYVRLAAEGKTDIRIESILDAVNNLAERDKNRRVAGHVQREGMYSRIDPATGREQLTWTADEYALLDGATQDMLRHQYVRMDARVFEDPQAAVEGLDGRTSTAWKEAWRDPGESPKWEDDGSYVFVKKGVADRIARQEETISEWWDRLGRIQGKMTLGLSVAWAMTQPLAEILTLAASHPNPVEWFRAWQIRQEIYANDAEAANMLGYAASTTIGTNTVTTAKLQNYDLTGRVINHMRQSEVGEMAGKLGKFEVLGDIDRWKGAFIRELGTIMELEHNLKASVRAAKAVNGQMDAIEKIADILAPMTPAERLRYMYSPAGIRDSQLLTKAIRDALNAGDQLINKVDRQQGNWTAFAPGREEKVASLFFFFPFTRFSLQWTFKNYPADHPARFIALDLLGAFNANIVDEILGESPLFIQEWAQVPVFNEEGQVTSLFPVNKLMHSGNAVLESLAGMRTPQDLMGPVMPIIPIAGNFLAGVDAYGNEIVNEDGEKPHTFSRQRVGGALDQFFSLAYPYREAKRQGLNIKPGEDSLLGKLGVDRIGWDEGRTAQVGDDPNGIRATIRRGIGPMGEMAYALFTNGTLGVPTESIQAKSLNQAIINAYVENAKKSGEGKSDTAKKGERQYKWKQKSLYGTRPTERVPGEKEPVYWQHKLKEAERLYGTWDRRYQLVALEFSKAQKEFEEWKASSPEYKAFRREEAELDEAALIRDSAAYGIDRMRKMSGLEGPSPVVSKEALKAGRELWKDRVIGQPRRTFDSVSGEWVFEGSRHNLDNDYDPEHHVANVPRGARAWRHLGHAQNLGFEQRDGDILRPDDQAEAMVRDIFADYPQLSGLSVDELEKKILDFNFVSGDVADRANRDKGGILAGVGAPMIGSKDVFNRLKGMPGIESLADLGLKKGEVINVPKVNPRKVPEARKMKVANRLLDLKEKVRSSSGGKVKNLPKGKEYLGNIYVQMSEKYGLGPDGPSILAGINEAETNFGSDLSVSSAGAQGWMQFMPETWASYGKGDPNDPHNAIEAAANYLKASGAPNNWYDAIFAYNHADWYVRKVQENAAKYPVEPGSGGKPDPKLMRKLVETTALAQSLRLWEKPDVGGAPVTLDTSRAGTDLKGVGRPVKALAEYLARSIGETKLDIMSGVSNHAPTTVTGTPSEHAVGNALDIYAFMDGYQGGDAKSQARGDKIAMNAIVALGGTRQEAEEFIANGRGLHNAPNGQVIWGQDSPDVGGNHLDHVHISARSMNRDWLPKKGSSKKVDKLPGSYDGSQELVSQLIGSQVSGDWGQPESSSTGYHNSPNSYAQDIGLDGHNPDEGEVPATQELLDQMQARIQSMGGTLSKDLVMGGGLVTGKIGPYELEIIPDSHSNSHGTAPHFHIGARYVGGAKIDASGGIGMSIMEQARASRYQQAAPGVGGGGTGTSSYSTFAGGGGGGGSRPEPGASWQALQSFRVGADPSQTVPLWGSGGDGAPSGKYESTSLAASVAKGLKVQRKARQGTKRSIASTLGMPEFRPTPPKRKKRNLA